MVKSKQCMQVLVIMVGSPQVRVQVLYRHRFLHEYRLIYLLNLLNYIPNYTVNYILNYIFNYIPNYLRLRPPNVNPHLPSTPFASHISVLCQPYLPDAPKKLRSSKEARMVERSRHAPIPNTSLRLHVLPRYSWTWTQATLPGMAWHTILRTSRHAPIP